MTKFSKITVIIIALAFIVWGAKDFYNYATISQDVLDYYDGQQNIKELVQYQLTSAFVKTLIGVFIAIVLFSKERKTDIG